MLLTAINAAYMAFSPRAWFRLPNWLRAQGSLTEQHYSSGWGAVWVRITGAVLLAVVLWFFYELGFNR
jgi:type VI protein secretion system component VasF